MKGVKEMQEIILKIQRKNQLTLLKICLLKLELKTAFLKRRINKLVI